MAWPKGVPNPRKGIPRGPRKPLPESEESGLPDPPEQSVFADDTERDVVQGQQANRLMGDPSFKLAVSQTETLFLDEARKGRSVEEREVAWAKLKALETVCLRLRVAYDNGQVAQRKLARTSGLSGF